jgi:hypothetical protein
MNSSDYFLWNLWLDISNLPEIDYNILTKKLPSFEELWETEWSYRFEKLMRSRLVMGPFRGYGKLNQPGKPQWDRIGRIKREIDEYERTHNLECLVEIANHALLEFEEGDHPDRYYKASNETKIHLFDPRLNKKSK